MCSLETERHLSTYDDTSEIALLNRDESRSWQDVSPTLFVVLQEARDVSELTGGSFDVTVAPLLRLWGYEPGERRRVRADDLPVPPTSGQLEQAREQRGVRQARAAQCAAHVGAQECKRHATDGRRHCARLRRGPHRDGTACASATRISSSRSGAKFVRAGQRPEGGPWRIAIEAPLATEREPLVGLRLRDAAVSTSGDYRDARIDTAGRRYSHTIDPRTGRTVQGALTAVTVIDANAIRADAYATALMVMGTEAGLAWAQAQRVPALFVERTATAGRVATRGIARILRNGGSRAAARFVMMPRWTR